MLRRRVLLHEPRVVDVNVPPRAFRNVLALAVAVAAGCTFTGLDNYSTPTCRGNVPNLDEDDCNTIVTGSTCDVYHCDSVTARCVRGPRDWDRDGFVDAKCGGDDCDDHNAKRNPRFQEVCDGLDNDCNGIVDDGKGEPVPSVAGLPLRSGIALVDSAEPFVSNGGGAGALAAYLVRELDSPNTCIQVTGDAAITGPSPKGCSFLGGQLGLSSAPTAPYAQAIGRSVGVVFVAGAPCTAASFRSASGGALSLGCGAVREAPSFATYDGGDTSVVAFFAADAATSARSIRVQWIESAGSAAPVAVSGALLTSDSFAGPSAAPVALVAVPAQPWVFAAAPSRGAVELWALGASTSLDPIYKVVPLASLPRLAAPHSVAIALGDPQAYANLAVLSADSGSRGETLALTLLHFDPKRPVAVVAAGTTTLATFTFVVTRTITRPAIAWYPNGEFSEWRVTWVAPNGAHALRVTANGTKIDVPFDLASGGIALSPLAQGGFRVLTRSASTGGVINDVGLGCSQ